MPASPFSVPGMVRTISASEDPFVRGTAADPIGADGYLFFRVWFMLLADRTPAWRL